MQVTQFITLTPLLAFSIWRRLSQILIKYSINRETFDPDIYIL